MSDFKTQIKCYLDKKAKQNELFAKKYANPQKNIDECMDFITSEVMKKVKECKQAQKVGMSNRDVFCLAIHYYEEDSIGEIKKIENKAVVYTGTDDEAQEIRAENEKITQETQRNKAIENIHNKPKKSKGKLPTNQLSLF